MNIPQPIRMAILDMNNNVENMGIASIKRIADRFAIIDYDVFDVRYKNEVPGTEYDLYISSGGPGDPLEGDGMWDKAYFDLMDELWQHNQAREDKKYVFFICHSFQMICHHMQIGKVMPRHKQSFGIVPVMKTEAGQADELMMPLHNTFYGADFRRYEVIAPDAVRLLELGSAITAMEIGEEEYKGEKGLMAVRFSDAWFGTQFHPEAHPDGMLHYLRRPEKKEMILTEFGMNTYEEMMHNALHPDRLTNTRDHILPGFIEDALEHILEASEPEVAIDRKSVRA
jgi:homoserine O-succinyltransferase